MECALISCKAYSTADFEHGPKALAAEGSAILAFSPTKPELANQGCEIVAAPRPEGIPEEVEPLWHALYAQFLALYCARMAGQDPDNPQFIRKVTRTL